MLFSIISFHTDTYGAPSALRYRVSACFAAPLTFVRCDDFLTFNREKFVAVSNAFAIVRRSPIATAAVSPSMALKFHLSLKTVSLGHKQ